MKVTGFTIIKDALKFDYPVVEAINSILPLCDDFIVAVGKSSDNTTQLIQNIGSSKIRIVNTEWDHTVRSGGNVLAVETNKALAEIPVDSDWVFYIQGDEVLHEKYHDELRRVLLLYKDDKKVDGLLFSYLHFYGSFDYVGSSSKWYDYEIRIIKNNKNIYSYRDAQGFRKGNNVKLNVKQVDACIYHYGWVKAPEVMQQKLISMNKHWHDDEWINEHVAGAVDFDYSSIDELQRFSGTHPEVMATRIMEKNWKFDYDISHNKFSFKETIKKILRKYFGWDVGYKNYKIL